MALVSGDAQQVKGGVCDSWFLVLLDKTETLFLQIAILYCTVLFVSYFDYDISYDIYY